MIIISFPIPIPIQTLLNEESVQHALVSIWYLDTLAGQNLIFVFWGQSLRFMEPELLWCLHFLTLMFQ
jgi:hypothetical protein